MTRPGFEPGPPWWKPATNRLSYGAAHIYTVTFIHFQTIFSEYRKVFHVYLLQWKRFFTERLLGNDRRDTHTDTQNCGRDL
jgi:hypothetical protein